MKYKKGDKVLVRATVYTKEGMRRWGYSEVVYEPQRSDSRGYPRCLNRVQDDEPWIGVVVGCSVRKTGIHFPGSGYDDPGELRDEKNHPVVMVIPTHTSQWIRPYACLESDLEPVQQ